MTDSIPIHRLDHLPLCTIAGSDPTGGAGLQGDLRTFAAHGGHGTAVLTATTVQDRGGLAHVEPVTPALVGAQLEVALRTARPLALKTGMLARATILSAVADVLDEVEAVPPLVVDPVLAAGAGGVLLEPSALPLLAERLAPHATVLTPNLPEAARLLGRAAIVPGGEEDAARALLATGWKAVLLKGGHGSGAQVVDCLATRAGVRRYERERLPHAEAHGTGCALSAALAARLAWGESLEQAAGGAIDYVYRLLEAAQRAGTWILPHLAVAPRPQG